MNFDFKISRDTLKLTLSVLGWGGGICLRQPGMDRDMPGVGWVCLHAHL